MLCHKIKNLSFPEEETLNISFSVLTKRLYRVVNLPSRFCHETGLKYLLRVLPFSGRGILPLVEIYFLEYYN